MQRTKRWGRVLWPWVWRYRMRWLSVVALPVVVVVMWALLGPVATWAAGPVVLGLPGKEQAAAMNAVRQTLLQAAGGTVALSALVFTATNYLLNRRGQFTDRYAAAIAQLASDKTEERIGGIYALEHLMRESEQDHSTVVEVLTSFVRENAPVRGALAAKDHSLPQIDTPAYADEVARDPEEIRPATDIQAALTVISRRPKRPEPNPVDLRRTDLQGADLQSASLDGANLMGAQLNHAHLYRARLNNALLLGAQLNQATLTHAQLNRAHLGEARLNKAALMAAQLNDTILENAQLNDSHLIEAQLRNANMKDAQLTNADLTKAQFDREHLTNAQLMSLRSITP